MLGYTSRDKTEGMRQALLHYRSLMEQMVGAQTDRTAEPPSKREMA